MADKKHVLACVGSGGALLSSLFMLVLAACGPAPAGAPTGQHAGEYPYRVVTTVAMVGDLVRAVAGDKAKVESLIGEGADPHLYKPTRDDVQKLTEAHVIFYNGLLLEGKMVDVLVKVGRTKPVHAISELISESDLLSAGNDGHHDPHIWMEPLLWGKCAPAVAEALAGYDPPNADYYRENARRFQQQASELHAYTQSVLGTIPSEQRVLITSHDAFNYLGRAYALEVRGVQGISTESEAGLADINRLVDLIVERKIRSVFVETSVAQKNVRALLEGAGSRGVRVQVGGTLFSDAMGAPGTYEGTWVGMIDHNVTTIARALGGTAPERGWQGRLQKP